MKGKFLEKKKKSFTETGKCTHTHNVWDGSLENIHIPDKISDNIIETNEMKSSKSNARCSVESLDYFVYICWF